MVDINKYLETQLLLSQKHTSKLGSKTAALSAKSKTVAEKISEKQHKLTTIPPHSKPESKSKTVNNCCDKDCELSQSSDEEYHDLSSFINHNHKPSVTKITDDGSTQYYNDRIKSWRADLAAASAKTYEGSINTADVKYVLDGHTNVNENHKTETGLCVPKYIWKQLYKYQRVGVEWLWGLHQSQSGGMLSDEMGLGKTVQVIAFLAGLSKTDQGSWGGLGPCIIVAPATVIYQWVSHFHYWCPYLRVAVLHNSGSHLGNHIKLIKKINEAHGVLLVTYSGITKYIKDLTLRKWHYVILDEGHKIRNPETQMSKTVKTFETPHRLIITGSPMQNSLQELWSLFDFVRPRLLGSYNVFMEYFAQPITQGGYANATEFQEATALEIAKALKNLITPYMLRRTKEEVQKHIRLPTKNEQVLFCNLTDEQKDLYMGYLMSGIVRSILDRDNRYGDPVRAKVLVALSTLRKICNHPDLYLYEAQEEHTQVDQETFGHWKRSGKLIVVYSLLKIWQKQGHRALIFSQSRSMLCLLEIFLQKLKYKYLKMDGTTNVSQRQSIIKKYNEDDEYLVLLATTRVGGLGVNLTGADRVIIYDPDWNPATDSQAKERAWRIGQKRNVTIYRLLSAGTIEEKIYQRQIFKHFLSNKIFVDVNQKNVLTSSTLNGLFTYDELVNDKDTETASLFKHTKVDLSNKINKDHSSLQNNLSSEKVKAMRKLAKEISKKISDDIKNTTSESTEDAREKYKKKRDLLLNPPQILEPASNKIDNIETNVSFECVLSELDIINMHSKNDYEDNLIKDVLSNTSKDQNTENNESVAGTSKNNLEDSVKDCIQKTKPDIKKISKRKLDKKLKLKEYSPSKKRFKESKETSSKNDSLNSMKKIENKAKRESKTDDDYVLGKLFAKAAVKNALFHDEVVGLAEKEKRYRLREEATKRARDALRAINISE